MSKILITGGSGLLGRAISTYLLENGHEPVWLGRRKHTTSGIKTFCWDPANWNIDIAAFKDVDYIIHLAGSGIMDHRWTKAYKKELIDSRVKSSELLFSTLRSSNIQLKSFVGASAIGYYGTTTGGTAKIESDDSGSDFVSEICQLWENSYKPFNSVSQKTAITRLAVILSDNGGAYPKLAAPLKLGAGSVLGSGKQFLPWIHVDDACKLICHVLFKNDCSGIYNASAGIPITTKQFYMAMAERYKKKILLSNTPEWLLRLVLGERSDTITKGVPVDGSKILKTGFKFKYENLPVALKSLK